MLLKYCFLIIIKKKKKKKNNKKKKKTNKSAGFLSFLFHFIYFFNIY